LFHHLFIGQASPQFHIEPAPFLALMILASATLVQAVTSSNRWTRFLATCVAVEMALRLLWPIASVKLQADRVEPSVLLLRLVSNDSALYFLLACLPAICGWWIATTIRNPRAVDTVTSDDGTHHD
jgi:hypothetical protein